MNTIGQKLLTLRKARGETLRDVSSFTGLSVSYLSDLERDRTEPSLKTLKALALFYAVKPSYLIDDETDYQILDGR